MFSLGKKDSGAWLLAGLGNPGAKYAGNRHNIGFMAADSIASAQGFPPFRKKFQGEFSEGTLSGVKVVLLKPQTFMNESGQSIVQAAKFFKIPPDRVIVFHDELDLAPGKVRVKRGGGNAGHNGLRSVESCLGTPDFTRVRLGIGHPGDREKVHGYVLSDFAKTDRPWIEDLLKAIGDHAGLLLAGKENNFASKVGMVVPVDSAVEGKRL